MRRLGQTRIIVLALLLLIAVDLGLFIAVSTGKPENRAVVASNQAVSNVSTSTAALTATFNAPLATAMAITATAPSPLRSMPTEVPEATSTFNAPFANEQAKTQATYVAATATWLVQREMNGRTEVAAQQDWENGHATVEAQISTDVALTEVSDGQTATIIAMTPLALRPTNTPTPTEEPIPTLVMGIFPEEYPGASGFYPTNGWRGFVDGEIDQVIAGNQHGAYPGPGPSMIRFYKYNQGSPQIEGSSFTPHPMGIIEVQGVQGSRATIVSTEPCYATAQATFDLKTRKWVDSQSPTPIPKMGILDPSQLCADQRYAFFTSGWRGVVNGKLIALAAGAETEYRPNEELDAPTSRSAIFISDGPDTAFDLPDGNSDTHMEAPASVGPIHIVSVKSNIIALANKDATTTFLFDLSNQVFISPPKFGPQLPIGFLASCSDMMIEGERLESCWRGVIEDKLISVAIANNTHQGANVIIFDGANFLNSDPHPKIYPEPNSVFCTGIIRLVGTMFFIECSSSSDNITFDITTGQFAIAPP